MQNNGLGGTKRGGDAIDDQDDFWSESSTKRHAHYVDPVTPSSREALAWPEVFTSIFGIDDVLAGPDNDLSLNEHFNDLDDLHANDLYGQAPDEQPALADVGRRIESWTEATLHQRNYPGIQDTSIWQPGQVYPELADSEREQCFGMLHECQIRLIYDMQLLRLKISKHCLNKPWARFHVSFTSNIAFLAFEDDSLCAQLDDRLYDPLHRICDSYAARLFAYVPIKDWMTIIDRAKSQKQTETNVDINVYGSTSVRSEVGRSLSNDGLYLQHVKHSEEDLEYENPHMLVYNDIDLNTESMEVDSIPLQNTADDDIQQVILDICLSETRSRDYREFAENTLVTVPLLAHQKQALPFMVERETGPIAEDFKLWKHTVEEKRSGFRHLVTGSWATEPPTEVGGGILADDPGMGKTLTALSLIAMRLTDGRSWAQSSGGDDLLGEHRNVRSRATLIVVPSLPIIDQWIKEIRTHLGVDFKILNYHGRRRCQQVDTVADSDLVFTTYHTLAKDRKARKSLLKTIHWFRIVLDEAHYIRRQATTLFTAAAELEACHRWCLTGTPIQNRLDDLGALLTFIRASPFDRFSLFRRYVIAPFLEDLDQAKTNLSLLLNSICIRRCRDRLNLPPLKERLHSVELSNQEQELYNETLESMSWSLSHGSQERDSRLSGTPFGKFQIQLQLRRLCNHGTFQRHWKPVQSDLQAQREDMVSSIGKDGEVRCSSCHERTPILATNCVATRQLPSCRHVLCHECISQLAENTTAPATDAPCPLCTSEGQSIRPPLNSRLRIPSKLPDFLPGGVSSKMDRLVQDVQDGLSSTRRLNLTAVNRIFLLEPQWNPSIEIQAIARAQRHLQNQTVTVTRYIVRGTVEEDIQRQQGRKLGIAEIGFQKQDFMVSVG